MSWSEGDRRDVSGLPRSTARTHDCIRAAANDAIFACRGNEAASILEETIRGDSRLKHNLKCLGELYDKAGESKTGCRSVRNEELQEINRGIMAMHFSSGWLL